MRLGSWIWGGKPQAGIVSDCGREVTPLALARPDRGVLDLIRLLAQGEALPAAAGPRLPTQVVKLCAPLPRPLRSLFCVGRNYRDHAAELSDTVFRQQGPDDGQWPMVFTKLADCVVGPHDPVRLPGREVSLQIDYESELALVIGRGGINIPRVTGDGPCVWLHHRQRRHGP